MKKFTNVGRKGAVEKDRYRLLWSHSVTYDIGRRNNMKKIVMSMAAIVMLALCGCSAGITRYGYELKNMNDGKPPADCQPVIKDNAKYEKDEVVVLGKIEAYETGVSITCDEAYVLDIFSKDACALGADILNITEEIYPNFWSSCYRAKAELLQLKNKENPYLLYSDAKYAPHLVEGRSKDSAERTQRAIEAGIMGGILGGLMVPH